MSEWNYRVVKQRSEDGSDEWYSIQEVYYDDDGKPNAYSVDLQIEGDTITGMRTQLQLMLEALDGNKPILDADDIIKPVNLSEADGLEIGPWEGMEDIDSDGKHWIYESPDGGKTLYRREFGNNNKREKIEGE